MDPRDTVDTPGTDPNRGMLASPYIKTIAIAVLVVLVVLLVAVLGGGHGKKAPVGPQTPATTSGQSNPTPQ